MDTNTKFESLVRKAAGMLGIEIVAVAAPTLSHGGSIRVTSRNDAITLSAALSVSGVSAHAASHRAFHGVYI